MSSEEVLLAKFGLPWNITIQYADYQSLLPICIIAFVLQFQIGIIGTVGNAVLIVVLMNFKKLHRNTLILLITVSIVNIIASLGYLVRSFIYLIKGGGNPFKTEFNLVECLFVETCIFQSVTFVIIFLLFIVIERARATYQHQRYEKVSNKFAKITVSILTSFYLLVIFGGSIYSKIAGVYNQYPQSFIYCNTVVNNLKNRPKTMLSSTIVFCLIEISSFCVSLAVVQKTRQVLNKYFYQQANLSLTSRLQLQESIDITRMLIPSIALHMIGYFLQALMIFIRVAFPSEYPAEILTSEYFDLVGFGLFFALHPLLCIWKNKSVRKYVRKMLFESINLKVFFNEIEPEVKGEAAGNLHINMLSSDWETRFRSRKDKKQDNKRFLKPLNHIKKF